MSPERSSSKTGAGAQSSVRICMRLTPTQRAELDRAAAEMKLSRSQVVRNALRHFRIEQAIGRGKPS